MTIARLNHPHELTGVTPLLPARLAGDPAALKSRKVECLFNTQKRAQQSQLLLQLVLLVQA
jgi:hypothetical protein